MLTNSRILVTGGAGFIGSNLVDVLIRQNNHVTCLDNLFAGKIKNIEHHFGNNLFSFIQGDIRDRETCARALENVDIVLHQAAVGSVPRSIKDPVTTNEVNISGFLNVITAAKDAGIKRFVFASSSSVYGDHPGLPKYEDKTGSPLSPYAVTKCVNELYARVFSDLYRIETIGLRYFNVFGKRQDPEGEYAAVIPKFLKAIIHGESPVIYGDGTQSRDFTYIDNVIQVNLLAAVTQNPGALNQVYNVAYGSSCTVVELFNILRAGLSRFKPEVMKVQPAFAPERPGDIKHSLASVEKARKNLGYVPGFDIPSGLELAIDWYWKELK